MVQSVMPSITGPFVLGGGSSSTGDRDGVDGGGTRGGGRSSGGHRPMSNEECGIREVWAHNMEEEFHHIRRIVQQYPYVAMVGTTLAASLSHFAYLIKLNLLFNSSYVLLVCIFHSLHCWLNFQNAVLYLFC